MRFNVVVVIVVGCAFVAPLAAQTDKEKQDRFNVLIQDNEALFSNISNKCEDEWPVDFRMQKYCQERQREGYTNLIELWPEALTKTGQAAAQCVLDWSEDLLFDWRMIHYCADRQLTAWKALQ